MTYPSVNAVEERTSCDKRQARPKSRKAVRYIFYEEQVYRWYSTEVAEADHETKYDAALRGVSDIHCHPIDNDRERGSDAEYDEEHGSISSCCVVDASGPEIGR